MLDKPVRLMIIGFVLLLIGVIFPFTMVLRVLESTFFLNFLSYFAQVSGLFLGVIGAAIYFKENRNKD
jgi:membrane associated rhomboid family serine protease